MAPNIIFIFVDDLAWGDLDCSGNLTVRTPRLNAMANEGARYSHLMSEKTMRMAMQVYYASIAEMDLQVGRLLEWIDAQPGLAEETLVVFSSDSGPEEIQITHAGYHAVGLPGPFRGRERSLYEGD